MMCLIHFDKKVVLCESLCVATNIELDEKLVQKAMSLEGLKTKREAVNLALEEFVRYREQLQVLDLFGTLEETEVDYEPRGRDSLDVKT